MMRGRDYSVAPGRRFAPYRGHAERDAHRPCHRRLAAAGGGFGGARGAGAGTGRTPPGGGGGGLAARLEAEKAEIAEQVRRLEHLNDELRKALFGRKSEKLGEDERQLSFDDLGTAVAEAGGAPAAGRTGRGGRGPPPAAAAGAPWGAVPGPA